MKTWIHSPWFVLTLTLVGLSIGYSVVVLRDADAMASLECPAKELCQGEGCEHNALCTSGECSKDCPGNCHREES